MNCKNKSFLTKKKAFTLIELLIVIAIIGILFIVLVSKVDFATDKAKATGVQTDFRSFQVAIESVAKEHAGLATFGWDTGDTNGDRIRNSYDKGDANQNGKQDPGEIFVGSKTYGETWTNVYTLTNPADANDMSAIAALEVAINANLDPKLHITIHDDLAITMANGAQDPWDTEYHGYYITNAEVDNKDRGAIIIYSNGANQEFGSEHSIANGVVTVNVPGNNVYGKDDYSIAVVYTYANGYGEVKTATTGFSNNQGGGQAGNLSNPEDIYSKTYKFANNITKDTLVDIWNKSTADTKDEGYALLFANERVGLVIVNNSEMYGLNYAVCIDSTNDYWDECGYMTQDFVDNGYVNEAGWHYYGYYDNTGDPCDAPFVSLDRNDTIYTVNGIVDLLPLFVEANLPQSTFETNVPYIFEDIYIVFKDDETVLGFYDEIVTGIIEGGDDISLQMPELNAYGTYQVFMDMWGKETVNINDGFLLEMESLIKTNKTYHDVFDSEMYIVLLMNCSITPWYNGCDLESTVSLMYSNGQFVDKNGNSYNDLNGMYIYNNIVFDEYDEPIGYVSMDGQYIEIYDDCNHYFLSKKGDVSRAEVAESYLNVHGFYENAMYRTEYYEMTFYSTGDVLDGYHLYKWRYDDAENAIIVYQEYNGVVRDRFLLTDNPNEILLINEYDNSTEVFVRDLNQQRQGILLEFVYEYSNEYGDLVAVVCHADKSITLKEGNGNRIRTIQADEAFYTYIVDLTGNTRISISYDGNFIEHVFWYE